jgi:cephalosporin hydroxylase
MSLWNLFYDNTGKDIFKWLHYLPIYESHFERYVNKPLTILEIGCLHGGSLQLWKRYFGPHATIVGIDIDPNCMAHVEDQISIRIGSQEDPQFLESVVAEFGQFDIVIDDGSHVPEHQIVSFKTLYPFVKENGIYVVEDLHTNYWVEPGRFTFMELAKNLVDELNAYHARGAFEVTPFTNSTGSMHFYDSMIFFEKAALTARRDLIIANRDGVRIRQQKQYAPYQKT